jgi:hypothetical protein
VTPEKPIIVRHPLPRKALPIAIRELALFGAVTEEISSSRAERGCSKCLIECATGHLMRVPG